MPAQPADSTLQKTPLDDLHRRLGARMVPFAGYEMPVQYRDGIVGEHLWTRSEAGLFDVSHMGQIYLHGADHATVAQAIERLVPGDIVELRPGQVRYTQFTTPTGGIIDDLMITRPSSASRSGTLYLVVNAARKQIDEAWLRENLPPEIVVEPAPELALIAIQGPAAEDVVAPHCPAAAHLTFMHAIDSTLAGIPIHISRSGYTGEDGFEISLHADRAVEIAETLLADERLKPIGLGARDSLRLEAGLCLYGHDIDETTSPLEAGLGWSVPARRREALNFIGAGRMREELTNGVTRRRVGIRPEGRAPAREGSLIQAKDGSEIGVVTSGGFGPNVGGPIAMGYVPPGSGKAGSQIDLIVRGRALAAGVQPLPFVPHRYRR